jgi:hypothetical protein
MSQGIVLRWSLTACVGWGALAAGHVQAQTAPRAPRGSRTANAVGESDAAASNFVDSLFTPFAPADPLPGAAAKAIGAPSARGMRPTWTARLARNPHDDGNAPFVLVDRYGGIQRYVESTPNVDLENFVGQTVAVRRDTGGTLLATQLDLPRTAARRGAAGSVAQRRPRQPIEIPLPADAPAPYDNIQLAQAQEPLVPTPADEGAVPTPAEADASLPPQTDQLPAPMSESIDGEIIEGPYMEGYEGPYHEGEVYYDDGTMVPGGDALYLDGNSEFHGGDCTSCGNAVCGGQGCNNPCGFGSRPVFYARGEYLNWWFSGMDIPPLVVNADIGPGTPPTLLNPRVVFGDEEVLNEDRSGGRITLGYFFDDYGKIAIEGDYLSFSEEHLNFQDGGDGTVTYVGRPYIDATTGLPAVEDVALVDVITGDVTVDIDSTFSSAGVRLRRSLCCVAGCNVGCGDQVGCGAPVGMGGSCALGGCDSCTSCGSGVPPSFPILNALFRPACRFINSGTRRVDVLYGVRWAELDEGLRINEDLVAADETTFLIDDMFDANNQFFGGEIGFLVDWQRRRWSVEFLSKLAIGNTRQRVNIFGQTLRDGNQVFPDHGLLAQPSNVGTYERDEFSVLPEVGLTGGYQITERLRVTLGYTLLYWSRVARPGDQIDLRVNPEFLDLPTDPSLLPDPDTIQPQSPEFVFRDTDFWAHGFNAGVDYRW